MIRICLYLLVLIAFVSCDQSTISFKEPQPARTRVMDNIPNRLTGVYVNLDDTTLLIIDEQTIRTVIVPDLVLKEKNNDITIDLPIKEPSNEFILFDFGRGDVLKSFKGYFFLNTQNNSGNWKVHCLAKSNKNLSIAEIHGNLDLGLLGGITGTTIQAGGETTFNPSKDDMRKFLKQGGLNNNIKDFVKINR